MKEIQYTNPKENIERCKEPMHRVDLVIDGKVIGSTEIEYFSKPFPIYQTKIILIK
jgi:hypothetical protein